jgi:chromate transporter
LSARTSAPTAANKPKTNLPDVERLFAGMNPAVVAIVASVAFGLGKKERRPWQLAVAALTLAAIELGVGVLEVMLLAIAVALLLQRTRRVLGLAPLWLVLPKVALVFLRIGAGSVAGGLAMIPMLDHEVVRDLHWLTPREFSDAVTLGQITPGPVAITATFIGFRGRSWPSPSSACRRSRRSSSEPWCA